MKEIKKKEKVIKNKEDNKKNLKKKINKKERWGIIKIKSTKSNTIINLTDLSGSYLFLQKSGGNFTKKGRAKNSSYVSLNLIKEIIEKSKKLNLENLIIEFKGKGGVYGKNTVGPNFKEIIRFLAKKKGGRRGRRV